MFVALSPRKGQGGLRLALCSPLNDTYTGVDRLRRLALG